MPRSAPWFLVVVLLAGLFLVRESHQAGSPVAALDEWFLDWLMANTGLRTGRVKGTTGTAAPTVALVEIDDTAVDPGAGKEAMSALDYALVLQAAAAFDPAVVAIAPVLEFPRPQPEYERILLDQALRTPKLLLAARPNGHAPGRAPPPAITPEVIVAPLTRVSGDRRRLPELRELDRRPAEPLLLAAAACGPTVVDPDAEVPSFKPANSTPPATAAAPAARTVPLLFRTPDGDVLPSFTLQAAMLWLQLTRDEVKVELPGAVLLGDRRRVPIDATGAMRLDFRPLARLPRIGIDDLILSANEKNAAPGTSSNSAALTRPTALARVPGGVLLLGRTDRTARTLAVPASGDGRGAPAELLALAIANIQSQTFIRRTPLVVDLLLAATLAALSWRLLSFRLLSALLLALATLLVYTLLALVAFDLGEFWLPWAMPAGVLGTAAAMLVLLPHGEPPRRHP